MLKFVEFETRESDKKTKLYAKLDNGSFVYITDYDYLYDVDLQFYSDENNTFVEVYCYGGVSYRIHDGRLLEYIQDTNGIGDEWEITLSMLDKCEDLEPVSSQPQSPFAL